MGALEPILAIDLGTTNSEVCAIVDGQPRILGAPGEEILPSFVSLSPEGKLLVGTEAKNQYVLYPERTVKSIKRKMGTSERVRLGDDEYTPQEISALILKKLKARAEAELGVAARRAVITVPAYFSDVQRQATRDAGELAGLEVVRIINEPTAAALAYTAGGTAKENVLVYDLGGGTFDVSVVRIEDGVVEVLASHGNNHLGGDDFDAKILFWLEERLREEHGVDPSADPRVKARLLRAAEGAKIRLSEAPFARIQEEYLVETGGLPVHLDLELSRREYEALIRPYVDETLQAIHTALDGAKVLSSQIDRVLLVGGATRTPLISETIRQTYGLDPRSEVNPDLCVALGAGIQAGMIGGERVGPVLVDVTPYTFGTNVLADFDGERYPFVYYPLILRNTAIPASRSEVFYTVADNQKLVEINVYQGEHRDAAENIRVGHFLVEDLSPVPSGNEIVIGFDLDVDGILKVTGSEKRTGKQKHITIERALSRLEGEDFGAARKRLAGLWEDDEEDPDLPRRAPPPAGGDADERHETVRARAVMDKARGMMNEIPEDDVVEVVGLIERIHEALTGGDLEAAGEATDELSDILFYLE